MQALAHAQVRVDHQHNKLTQQSLVCEFPGHGEQAQALDPLLQPWSEGGRFDTIHVPSGYHLFTYPDG